MMIPKKIKQFFLLTISSSSVFAATNSVDWSYFGNTGPGYWGGMDASFALCSQGKTQSPINIVNPVKPDSFALEIKYQPAPIIIANNGETDLLLNSKPVIIHNGHAVQLNFPVEGTKETILFRGKAYHLKEFHFHTPGETAMNGKIAPMEIHFVNQSEDGQVAVVAVMVTAGAENTELNRIIQNIPRDQGIAHEIANEMINPMQLMPQKREYYYFVGSLTTPPCTEGLHWLVMPATISASNTQIDALRKAVGGNNARPLQPLNQRNIYHSVE